MKLLNVLAAAIVLAPVAAPAQSLRQGATTFCNAVRDANRKNISAAPGTWFATYVAQEAGQTSSGYRDLWQVAKSLDIPACRAMW